MKTLIGCFTGWQFPTRRARVRTTWMGLLDAMQIHGEARNFIPAFVFGARDVVRAEKLETALFLPCPNEYAFLPMRTRLLCKWAVEVGFDGLWKIDDDTQIDIDRLINYSLADSDYVGYPMINKPPAGREFCGWRAAEDELCCDHLYASGNGYYLSRRAMEIVANDLTMPTGPEDLLVGRVLNAAGIRLCWDRTHFHPFAEPGEEPGPGNDWVYTSPKAREE